MFYQTSMGLIYLIFNQLPFLWDTSVVIFSDAKLYKNNYHCFVTKLKLLCQKAQIADNVGAMPYISLYSLEK